jgi:hypothetical protein
LAAAIRSQPLPASPTVARRKRAKFNPVQALVIGGLLVAVFAAFYLGRQWWTADVWTGPVTVQWWDAALWSSPGWRSDTSQRSLTVAGAVPGLLQLPSGELFRDFEADFVIAVRDGQKSVGWIVRARDNRNYHLFRYTFPAFNPRRDEREVRTVPGMFESFAVKDGVFTSLGSEPMEHLPLRTGHFVYVRTVVRERNAEHRIRYSCPPSNSACTTPDPQDGEDLLRNATWRLDPHGPEQGRFGFVSTGLDDRIEVRRLELRGLPGA